MKQIRIFLLAHAGSSRLFSVSKINLYESSCIFYHNNLVRNRSSSSEYAGIASSRGARRCGGATRNRIHVCHRAGRTRELY